MVTKRTRKGATKAAPKMPLMSLTQVEEKELVLDTKTVEKLEEYLEKNGGAKSGLTISDLVTHLILDKGPNGFKFAVEQNEEVTRSITMPKAAWDIAEKSAQKSGNVDLSDVVKELASKL